MAMTDTQQVAPELQKLVRRASPPLPLNSALGRRAFRFLGKLVVPNEKKLSDVKVEVKDSLQPLLRIYYPKVRSSDAALLWIHGGGFVLGNAALDGRLCALTARTLGIIVVSIEYRLVPEHPFPAPLDDCYAAWQWMQQAASSLGINPKRIAV